MPTRHEYQLELSRYQPRTTDDSPRYIFRHPTPGDADRLAELMLDAYRGTIDDEGETLEDAQAEVNRLFAGEYGALQLEHSWLCFANDTLLCACLISFWNVRQVPLISFVMTATAAKGHGLAAVVLQRSLQSLQAAGYEAVHAFITEGNTPSERLHRTAGFAHLPLYHWDICPAAIRQPVLGFVAAVKGILGTNLLGIYLHGSLAFGCFNPNRSDIDLLVVNQELMNSETKHALAQLLLATSNQPHPLEISFLARQHLQPWQYPTPFDFHYSEDWRAKLTAELNDGSWQNWQPNNTMADGDADLSGHISVLNERGIVLAGEPISAVFPAVPTADYQHSILNDIRSALAEIEQNPVYAILNTCRTLAWLQDGQIRSKDTGGVWALQHLPVSLHGTVKIALAAYRSEKVSAEFGTEEFERFVEEVGRRLGDIRDHSFLPE